MQIGQRHQAYSIIAHALHPVLRIGSKYKYSISLMQRQLSRAAGLIVEQGSRLIPPFDPILSLFRIIEVSIQQHNTAHTTSTENIAGQRPIIKPKASIMVAESKSAGFSLLMTFGSRMIARLSAD